MKTVAQQQEEIIRWLEQIYEQVQRLLINDNLFWEFQKVVESNDEFLKASGLFTEWIAASYSQSAIIGVRRQAKHDSDSISLKGFLLAIESCPELVSRAHYMKLFDGKELFHKRIGEKDFDRVAGQGSEHIPVVLIQQQLDEIKQAVSSVEKYADRRIAHYDRRQPARPFPTFGDLTAAIKALEKIVILYWRLLKGPSMSTMLPTIMFDWKDIFRFVWEPPEAAGTQPLI